MSSLPASNGLVLSHCNRPLNPKPPPTSQKHLHLRKSGPQCNQILTQYHYRNATWFCNNLLSFDVSNETYFAPYFFGMSDFKHMTNWQPQRNLALAAANVRERLQLEMEQILLCQKLRRDSHTCYTKAIVRNGLLKV